MLLRCYALAPGARLVETGGRSFLVSGYPLQQAELNPAAARVIAALRSDVPLEDTAGPFPPATIEYLERKVSQGLLSVEYRVTPPSDWPEIEAIVPVLDNPAGLARCLAALARLEVPPGKLCVTVVDDGSAVPAREAVGAEVPAALALRWIRLASNSGPAGARNAALRTPWPGSRAPAPLCAFVDSDCVPTPGWLAELAGVLDDPALAAAGGRVAGLRQDSWLARYEAQCSSLNLGPRGGEAGRRGGRIAYLPTCNLLARRAALEQVGGFRDGWRLGEDVDLCWRMDRAGLKLFYTPGGTVAHDYRRRLPAFLARKRDYARSEAALRAAHPERFAASVPTGLRAALLACVAVSALSVIWGAAGLAAVLALDAARRAWRVRELQVPVSSRSVVLALARGAAALALRESRAALRGTLAAWPVPLLAWPGLLPAAALVSVLGAWAEWMARRPQLSPLEFAAGLLLDALAYSAGRVQNVFEAVYFDRVRTRSRGRRR